MWSCVFVFEFLIFIFFLNHFRTWRERPVCTLYRVTCIQMIVRARPTYTKEYLSNSWIFNKKYHRFQYGVVFVFEVHNIQVFDVLVEFLVFFLVYFSVHFISFVTIPFRETMIMVSSAISLYVLCVSFERKANKHMLRAVLVCW